MYNNKSFKPNVLYKYTTIETGLKILETQTIRFSNPKTFNDPYDSNMPIVLGENFKITRDYYINFCNYLIKHPEIELPETCDLNNMLNILKNTPNFDYKTDAKGLIEKMTDSLRNNMRVLSLSAVNDSILMWGHYSDCHKGIVIGFNTRQMFFKNTNKIQYSKKIPKIKGYMIKDIAMEKEESIEELKKLFCVKYSDWEYEQEYRSAFDVIKNYEFLSQNTYVCNTWPNLIKELKERCNYIHQPFSLNCIDSIYLGSKTNIIDEYTIVNLVKNKYPQSKIYRASLSDTEFKIKFKQI